MTRKQHFCDEIYAKNIDKNKSTPFFWSTQPSSWNLTFVEENERQNKLWKMFSKCVSLANKIPLLLKKFLFYQFWNNACHNSNEIVSIYRLNPLTVNFSDKQISESSGTF